MIISAGALFKAENTNRCLFVLRSTTTSYASTWALVGGKIHYGEKVLEGLTREIREEVGYVPKIKKWAPFNYFINNKDKQFCYHSILVSTPKEFIPKLNNENNGYAWVDIEVPPKPLHPRLREVITSNLLIESIKKF